MPVRLLRRLTGTALRAAVRSRAAVDACKAPASPNRHGPAGRRSVARATRPGCRAETAIQRQKKKRRTPTADAGPRCCRCPLLFHMLPYHFLPLMGLLFFLFFFVSFCFFWSESCVVAAKMTARAGAVRGAPLMTEMQRSDISQIWPFLQHGLQRPVAEDTGGNMRSGGIQNHNKTCAGRNLWEVIT